MRLLAISIVSGAQNSHNRLTWSQNRPSHLPGSILEVMLDHILRLEMWDRRLVLPARLVTSPFNATVHEVFDAGLYTLVDHVFALLDFSVVGHTLALRDLHAVHTPNGALGYLECVLEQRRYILLIALHHLDVVGFGCKSLSTSAGRVAGLGQESELWVVCKSLNDSTALVASCARY